jgi:hypothetical protein
VATPAGADAVTPGARGRVEARITILLVALGAAREAAPGEARPLPDPIVMMWQVAGADPASDIGALRELGVNTVQSFSLVARPQDYVERYLAAAETAGMGVIPFVGNRKTDRGDPCELPEAGIQFILRHRSSAAIVAWHSADEPELRDIPKACQVRLYARIKALDATRPVLVSANLTSQEEYDTYFAEDAFDILDLHKYVNWRVASPQRDLVRLFRENRRRSYPVIVTLRAFDSPHKFWRFDMDEGDLLGQYRYFFEEERLTRNVGFYGWNLSPNRGIADLPALRSEFERLMREQVGTAR